MEILETIVDYPPFNTLNNSSLKYMIESRFKPTTLPPYTLLTEKGQKISRIGFILSGNIDLLTDTQNGHSPYKGSFGKGAYFGIESLFNQGVALFDEMTTEKVDCLTVNINDFLDILSKDEDIMYFFDALLISNLKRFFHNPLHDTETEKNYKTKNPRLQKSIEYIDTHYMKNLCLDDIAQITGLSRFHFSRVFKQVTGHNFKDYLNLKRLEAAKRLMQLPEINISQACFSVGFNDASYFSRLFKKYERVSPSFYRKACHKRGRRSYIVEK